MRALVSYISAEALSSLLCYLRAMSSLSLLKPFRPHLSSLLRQRYTGFLPILGCVFILVVLSRLHGGHSMTGQAPGNAGSVRGLHGAGFQNLRVLAEAGPPYGHQHRLEGPSLFERGDT